MIQNKNSKTYDLEDRTLAFARQAGIYVDKLPHTVSNQEYGKQLVRSSASIGANYIEANESLSKKDFLMRIKISRKEAKETCYWLQLIVPAVVLAQEREVLLKEATELMKIFGAILEKSKN